jgi:homoserine kinase
MTMGELGGMTFVTDSAPVLLIAVEGFFSVLASFPNARLAGRVMRRLSPTHMPLADTSHPAGRAPTP